MQSHMEASVLALWVGLQSHTEKVCGLGTALFQKHKALSCFPYFLLLIVSAIYNIIQ